MTYKPVGVDEDSLFPPRVENRLGVKMATFAADAVAPLVSGQPSRLVSILRRNVRDAVLVVLGDSTGNEPSEWVYLLALWLADLFPAVTVSYRLWSDAAQDYDAALILQTGTGPHTLHIYNGSHPGAGYNYSFASAVPTTRFFRMLPVTPDTVVISYGYNSNTPTYRQQQLELSRWVLGNFPGAEYVATSQPPKATADADAPLHLSRQQDTRDVALSEGWGLVDATQAFIDFGDYDELIDATDHIHPTPQGSQVWFQEVRAYFGDRAQRQQPALVGTSDDRRLIPATAFTSYFGSPALGFPAGIITPMWAFDAAAEEMIAALVDLPPSWRAAHVDLLWSGPTAAAGDVVWQVDHYALTQTMLPSSGKPLAAATAGAPITVTQTANSAVRTSRVYTAERFSGGRPLALRVRRQAAAGADTSTQDAWFFGLLITRAE